MLRDPERPDVREQVVGVSLAALARQKRWQVVDCDKVEVAPCRRDSDGRRSKVSDRVVDGQRVVLGRDIAADVDDDRGLRGARRAQNLLGDKRRDRRRQVNRVQENVALERLGERPPALRVLPVPERHVLELELGAKALDARAAAARCADDMNRRLPTYRADGGLKVTNERRFVLVGLDVEQRNARPQALLRPDKNSHGGARIAGHVAESSDAHISAWRV
eukprot:Amastigsp_a340573_47.p2 type:complete len:220 gc:universal Amastigsp_a340573_47:94-753(+)